MKDVRVEKVMRVVKVVRVVREVRELRRVCKVAASIHLIISIPMYSSPVENWHASEWNKSFGAVGNIRVNKPGAMFYRSHVYIAI